MAGARAGPGSRRPGARAHLSREPQRPRRAADAPRPRRGRDAARGRPAVVHGALRPRQPDHELPGAALPSRAGRHDPARPRRTPGARRATTSTSRSRARSCTSCASASSPLAASAPIRPYYGTADATPLFLVLLDEYHRWTGDDALVRALEPNARAALAWIEEQRRPRRRRVRRVRVPQPDHRAASTSAGRTAGTRSSSPTARSRADRSRPARSRATPTTPSGAAARLAREVWNDRRAQRPARAAGRTTSRRASAATSGCPSAAVTPSRSTATNARSTA